VPLVIKLGGSHASSALLRSWLRVIAETPGAVLVPGGGPFADTVRAMQTVMSYDDDAAHDMALMAMGQYARALTALSSRLIYADDPARLRDTNGRVPVFSPWPALRDAPDLPRSWDVTSDSIALWLATMLNAPAVVLVKHRQAPSADATLLAAEGVVDAAFPGFLARYKGAVHLAGPSDLPTGRLDPAHLPGLRIQ